MLHNGEVASDCPGFDAEPSGVCVVIRTPGQWVGHERTPAEARALAQALTAAADDADRNLQAKTIPVADASDETLLGELASRGLEVSVADTRLVATPRVRA